MATIEGGGTSQVPADQQAAANEVLLETFEQVEELFETEVTLESEFSSPTLNVFTADLPQVDLGVSASLFLVTPPSSTALFTLDLSFLQNVITQLELVTAQGSGVFSIFSKSFASQTIFLASALEDGSSVHALTTGEASSGVDSLTGGGSAVSDAQASFITGAAQDMGLSNTVLTDIAHSLKLLSKAGTTTAAEIGVEIARLTLSDNANFSEIGLGYDAKTLVFARLDDLPGGTLALSGMEKALVVNSGSVRIDSNGTGTIVVGDTSNQTLISGLGNDTLVGGGGSDTLVGGAGADVFGFNKRGHYTITDFVAGVDKAYFEFDGVTTVAQVKSYLTAVTENNGNTTFHFGDSASITLIGVSANAAIGPLLFDV